MTQIILLPSAASETTIKPAGGSYGFQVNQNCTVCFGTASPPGSFPPIEGNTYQWKTGITYGPYTIPNVDDSLPYNTAAPNSPCNPGGIQDIGHVIIVGAGVTGRTRARKKGKKSPAKKKSAGKKAGAKSVKKSAPKKAARAKTAKKQSAKKKTAGKKAAKKSSRRR